jgi:mannose-6-phosphate isomerase
MFLQFEPILKEKIWGGNALRSVLNKKVPQGKLVGESWELSGVAGSESVALSGSLQGKTLTSILEPNPWYVVGSIPNYRGFPLLYKFLDVHKKLSIQVHPDDAQAKSLGLGDFGKSECWYVIEAAPDSHVACGFKSGVSRDSIRNAAGSEAILSLLNLVPVVPGDVIFVPGGTVHAVLGGVLLYEVQETADITFRLYDWNRPDTDGRLRPLHIRESMEILDTTWHDNHKIPAATLDESDSYTRVFRVASRHFALEEYQFHREADIPLPAKKSFRVVTVCKGDVSLRSGSLVHTVHKGETVLVPERLPELRATAPSGARFLLSSVPDLTAEVVDPLRAQGASSDRIVRLGGNPATSDLAALV